MAEELRTLSFEDLSDTLFKRMKGLKSSDKELYIHDRMNDTVGFLNVYKDALYHYVDGIVLGERLYFEKVVQFEEKEMPAFTDENRAIYNEFIEFANNLENNPEMSPAEAKRKVEEYLEKFRTTNAPMRKISVPYLKNGHSYRKYLLGKLSEIPDEVLESMTKIIANYILSFFQAMFYVSNEDYNIILQGIETDTHIDIVALIVKGQNV